jgi:LuxR family maltose regulon positive regulatory protein
MRARDARLALIVAPAGYGKSTLLAEWAACDERPFIWARLRADESEDAVVASVTEAFQDWAQSDLEFVLVLDDAQLAPKAALKSVITELLDQLSDGSQIALSSRTEPPLPIGRLRAHRALVEVREQDLAMSPAEAASLLRAAGLELEFGAVQALVRQTEGWPVGLYLAALSLREQDDLAAGLNEFGGDDHRIAEYFRDEFLAELSPELTRFLRRTSVLDDLSGPLCDAVLERNGSGNVLAGLARRNVMLVPLDQTHDHFRWHRLFRAALRAELRRTEPQIELSLHDRASTWLARQGCIDDAIEHAVAADEACRAGDLLWANVAQYLASGRIGLVQDWLKRFSPEQLAGHAPLAVAAAHSALMSGDVDQARHWGLLAADAKRRPKPRKATPSVEAGIAIIAAATSSAGAPELAVAAERAYQLEPEGGPWRPICCWLQGTAEHLAGDRELATRRLEEGLQLSASGAPSIASLCLAQLVMIEIEQENWDFAGELADRAAKIVDRQPLLAEYPISALVFAAAAATRAREGRVDEAKQDLRNGADLLAALGDFIPWYGAETRIMLAQAALGLADTVRARTLLAEASRLARKTPGAVIFQAFFDQAWAQIDTMAETALAGPSSLTIAELRILRFLPSHRSFREIAERLGVSVNTVKTQAHAIYRKLDAASRSEAVARASAAGLLGP